MKNQKNKTLTAITLTLILTMTVIIASLPTLTAQENPEETMMTYIYVSTTLNPVGINQDTILSALMNMPPPTASGAYGDRWKGIEITVTKPDGTKDVLGPFTSDPLGSVWTLYTPTQIGEHTLQSSFPGQILEGENLNPDDPAGREYIGWYFEPSTSDPETLVVQQEPIEEWEETAIPEDYWDRPIDDQHRNWWSISGNWLIPDEHRWALQPALYTKGPETAHILWRKTLTTGGLVGGELESHAFHEGGAYEGKMYPPVIINGILYYNQYPGNYGVPGYYAVDLRTGEEIYHDADTRINFGQTYYYSSPNQHGVHAYLWQTQGRTWNAYDAFSGHWVYTIENAGRSSVTQRPKDFQFGPVGNILVHRVDTVNNRLTLWDPAAIPELLGAPTGSGAWQWRPWGKTVDGNNGYVMNVSIPANLPGNLDIVLEDRIIGSTLVYGPEHRTGPSYNIDEWTVWALSLKPGEEGKLLWKKDYVNPDRDTPIVLGEASLDDGVFLTWTPETRQWRGYSTDTGELVWGPTDSQTTWDFAWSTQLADFAYGKFWSCGYGGILYCYDAKTGKLEWIFEPPSAGLEAQFGGKYPLFLKIVADEKIYVINDEHSPVDPKSRGAKLFCVDTANGEEVWSISHWGTPWSAGVAMADGILVTKNGYDNQIYAFGKGRTATTVTAPKTVVPQGTAIMIEGTVTDQSEGAKGTPAIADKDMTAWMEYLYMQFEMPMDATGVPVTLDAVGPDGSFTSIDTVTSDASGMFKKMWTPPSEGEYTIIATFAGSGAYWSSYAETSLGVSAESTTLESSYDLYILAAVIILIAIVLIVAVLVLRKQ